MKSIQKRILTSFLILPFLFLVTACNSNSETEETTEKDTVHETHDQEKHEVHWSYEGETGPEHWTNVVPNCTCDGKSQSPIDISGEMVDSEFVGLTLNYHADSTMEIVNNGHTIQVNYPHGTFNYNDIEYKLAQFHFHAGSEHTLNGEQFPLEAHLVHISDNNDIAVIGIWFKEGGENTLLKKLTDKLPQKADEKVNESITIDIKDLMPAKYSYYHYSGSLTTPPCTEGVSWFVIKDPEEASEEQIAQIAKFMPDKNFRPVQALNDRKVEDF